MSLINCKLKLDLSWSKSCIISEISGTAAVAVNPNADPLVQASEGMVTDSCRDG